MKHIHNLKIFESQKKSQIWHILKKNENFWKNLLFVKKIRTATIMLRNGRLDFLLLYHISNFE